MHLRPLPYRYGIPLTRTIPSRPIYSTPIRHLAMTTERVSMLSLSTALQKLTPYRAHLAYSIQKDSSVSPDDVYTRGSEQPS